MTIDSVGSNGERGAVLFEVLLALILFASAAAVITSGMSASVEQVEKLRLETHAMNLAASVMAELEAGIRSGELSGPEQFEAPYEEWNWEIRSGTQGGLESASAAEEGRRLMEVIVWHETSGVRRSLTSGL